MAWNEAEARKLMSEDASPRNDTEDPEEAWTSTTNGYFDDSYEIDGEDVMYILAALQRGRKVCSSPRETVVFFFSLSLLNFALAPSDRLST